MSANNPFYTDLSRRLSSLIVENVIGQAGYTKGMTRSCLPPGPLPLASALLLGLLAACGPAAEPVQLDELRVRPFANPSPSPTPTGQPTSGVSASNLAGAWVMGGPATSPGPAIQLVKPKCAHEDAPASYLISQQGTAVTLRLQPARVLGGAQQVVESEASESASGELRDGRLTLTGQAGTTIRVHPVNGELPSPPPAASPAAVRWELTYDPASRHLVGTRAGAPVRLVPVVVQVDPSPSCMPPRPAAPPPAR